MKTLFTIGIAVTLALALAVGCSDDGGKTKDDKGVTIVDGTVPDGPVGPTPDGPVGPTPDGPVATGQNSGQTCSAASPTCPTGDDCIGLQGWPADTGMCVATCPKQGDICPTSDNTKYSSQCAASDQGGTVWHCLFICAMSGMTYQCPGGATQDCIESGTAGVKLCAPKGGTPTPDAGL